MAHAPCRYYGAHVSTHPFSRREGFFGAGPNTFCVTGLPRPAAFAAAPFVTSYHGACGAAIIRAMAYPCLASRGIRAPHSGCHSAYGTMTACRGRVCAVAAPATISAAQPGAAQLLATLTVRCHDPNGISIQYTKTNEQRDVTYWMHPHRDTWCWQGHASEACRRYYAS